MRKRDPVVMDQDLESLTNLFRLLSDKTRLNILLLLAGGERNVTSLCNELSLPQPTVSHHLGLLRMNNLIANRRNGKQVFYGLHSAVNADDSGTLQVALESFELKIIEKADAGMATVASS
jgi:DNA-binding transcriptional ArsR family regulator